MRYGTWKIIYKVNNGDNEGTTPLATLGIFFASPHTVAGYIPDSLDISQLNNWNVNEITQAQFLTLAQSVNPLVTMDASGKLVVPSPQIV